MATVTKFRVGYNTHLLLHFFYYIVRHPEVFIVTQKWQGYTTFSLDFLLDLGNMWGFFKQDTQDIIKCND